MKLERIVLYDRARPHALHEVALGDELTGRPNQNLDYFERAAPDRDRNSARSQFTSSEIDLPLARFIHQSSALRGHVAAPYLGVIQNSAVHKMCIEIADRFGLPGKASQFLRTIQHCFKELMRFTTIKRRPEVTNAEVVDDDDIENDQSCPAAFAIQSPSGSSDSRRDRRARGRVRCR
jgi:hypothetical protein